MIRNNKKLTDINLNLIHDGSIKSNIIIYMDGNAFSADTLNKIMTNLPDINSMEKLDETYTNFKNKLIATYLDLSSKICENNEVQCNYG